MMNRNDKKENEKFEKIIELIKDGKLDEALMSVDVNDVEILIKIGTSFGTDGFYDIADKIFDRVIQLNPSLAEIWSNKGNMLDNLGRHAEALKCYDEAITINPNLAEAWYNKGNLLVNLGKYAEAINCYDEAITINPNFAEAWSNKGITLGNLGRHAEAIKCYDEAIKINPNYASALSNKGNVFVNLGKYAETINCYDEAIKIDPNYAKAWYNKGIVLFSFGKYIEALNCYDEVIKINPNFAEAWSNKGSALVYLGKYTEALKCYDEAIKINPNLAGAWSNKGMTLVNIGKYAEAIKCYDETITINPNLAEAWYNKGIALDSLGKYADAIKCYDEAIKINHDDADSWSNKGNALDSLGKYADAIKCYDEAITINPNYAVAWYNKGNALINLDKYDEAIKCYDKAITINPNFAEAYINLGATLLSLHKYDDAAINFKKAKELFSKRTEKKDADKAYKYEVLAQNSSNLMNKLEPLDKEFLNSLNAGSLVELKEKSCNISKSIEDIYEEFEEKTMPEDAIRLLFSKKVCYTALSKALQFEEVDLNELEETKNIFGKWNLYNLANAVDSLVNFIQRLNKYSEFVEISKIPNDVENGLLRLLNALLALDGMLTKEIKDKIKGEPYPSKLTDIKKPPEIKYITIPDFAKDRLRVCIVQLDFSLPEKFPFQLENKEVVKEKILKALKVAQENKVDIICFPELSFAQDFVNEIKKYNDIIIIGGSYYQDNFNICPVIINGEVHLVCKICPSYFEGDVEPGKGMKSGNDIKIFRTNDNKFKFVVLVCLDYLNNKHLLYQHQSNGEGVNFIFNPSFNKDTERFQKTADTDCVNYNVDLIQTNVKEYGGTCIIGVEDKEFIKVRLINGGYRKDDGITYKLCEADGEMIIIADLSLKRVEIPKSAYSKPRIQIIGRYIYKETNWELLS